MSDIEVRVIRLPRMRVACVHGFGEGPEGMAFDKLRAWAAGHNLPNGPHRIFGYNNPDPSPGSPNYGYDVWLTVDETVKADEDARIIDFPGGLYAVTRIEVRQPWDDIPGAWQKLVQWMQASKYRHGRHQWLEEHIGPLNENVNELPFTLDLHLPIAE